MDSANQILPSHNQKTKKKERKQLIPSYNDLKYFLPSSCVMSLLMFSVATSTQQTHGRKCYSLTWRWYSTANKKLWIYSVPEAIFFSFFFFLFYKGEKKFHTEVLGVMKASGVISLGIGALLVPEFDRKSEGAGRGGIFLRSVCEPLPDSLSELWSVRWSENPADNRKQYFSWMSIVDWQSIPKSYTS